MFVSRRVDNSIYGAWTVRQFQGQEELADGNPELVAFVAGQPLLDVNDFQSLTRFLRAKCISDLAFRLGVAPGALTAVQIQAERTRVKGIADALP